MIRACQAALLKSLLEVVKVFVGPIVLGSDEPVQFLVPLDANGKSPFRQINEANLKSVSDIMMLYIKFQSIVNDQQDVQLMLEQNASNMITCIETNLNQTIVRILINSIQIPLKTQMITFRSD